MGYMLRCAPTPGLRDAFWRSLPRFVRILYPLAGERKFEKEWAYLYGGDA